MQSRIYGFEIVRSVQNGVYEARETDNNASVILYEWTPATEDRDAAKLRLSEIQEQLNGKAFSADASLYLVAISKEEGEDLLKILQSHKLFAGVTSGAPPAPPPPPRKLTDDPPIVIPKREPALPAPPPRLPAETAQKSSFGMVWLAVLAVIICAGVAYAIGNSAGQSTASDAAARRSSEASSQASQELSAAQSQNSDLQSKLSTAEGQLKNLQGIQALHMTNKTKSTVHVAVMYKNWAGIWVFSGWQSIAPDARELVATASDGFFLFTAYSDSGVLWEADSDKYTYRKTTGNFISYAELESHPDWEAVKLIPLNGLTEFDLI